MHDLLVAAGPLADDHAAVDRAASPLGAPQTWSAAMTGALEVVLHSRYPAALLWGPQFVQVYDPGEALLLCTDGLVRRRGQSLDEGQRWLVDEVARHQGLTLDELCDHLLAAVGDVDDDVAVLAVRVPLEA